VEVIKTETGSWKKKKRQLGCSAETEVKEEKTGLPKPNENRTVVRIPQRRKRWQILHATRSQTVGKTQFPTEIHKSKTLFEQESCLWGFFLFFCFFWRGLFCPRPHSN